MDSFVYSVNATLPIFLVMLLGYLFMRRGLLTENFVQVGNKLMFQVALPFSLYRSVSQTDFAVFANGRLVLYCIIGTVMSFAVSWLVGLLVVKDRSSKGSFIQGCARGNIAILGFAFIQNMYGGEVGAMPLVIAISVTAQNLCSVFLLSVYDNRSEPGDKKAFMKNAMLGIAKNPLLHALLLGLLSSFAGFTMPQILDKTMANVAALSTPLALIVLGAGFDFAQAKKKISLTIGASVMKLLVLPGVMMPVAIWLGYRDITLASLLLMSGSSTAVSSYIMARNMNNDEVLASSVVAVTTLMSSLSLTFWIFLLRFLGYL